MGLTYTCLSKPILSFLLVYHYGNLGGKYSDRYVDAIVVTIESSLVSKNFEKVTKSEKSNFDTIF